ncbi:MAG: thioredoxin domain-containing protein [Chitinophagaceae bacterium]|nr:thioredoxin domain-containing protein [Chitinophagaceae bacterium]
MNHSNRLINETSPYLLQHAHNPVDWYAWGDEALQRAKQEDRPMLVSIGYAACHWCHVMERESFEDLQTAALMNQYFVCIKIDREERPDLDHFFMDALQATSGNGGWPLNMFLTSDGKPFYGGTYFPPQSMHNRISWKELLVQIHGAYQNRRADIEEQANNLIEHLQKSNQLKSNKGFQVTQEEMFAPQQIQKIFNNIMGAADQVEGGFGNAPKFPQTYTIQYLLRYHHFTGNKEALDQAILSLKKMMRGGIYDQLGGGFCRYSTDAQWLAPHFEKMTYDNALLLLVLAEAFQLTGDPEYKRVAVETIGFMQRELQDANGGFYAALDADSEGEEGKFYTWIKKEFEQILGEDAVAMAALYDVTEHGNWEEVNILRMQKSIQEWAEDIRLTEEAAKVLLAGAKTKLMDCRSKRVRPATDDKIILGWNALFNQALSKAGKAFGEEEWIALAAQNMAFLLSSFEDKSNGQLLHTHKAGVSKYPAFLDDVAYLIQALLYLYEPTGSLEYLEKARVLMQYAIENFGDEEQLFFYYTPSFQTDILVRKKDLYDGAIPSGNSIMAWNLHRLGLLFNQQEWRKRAEMMMETVKDAAVKYPTSYGIWANLFLEYTQGTHEILVLGPQAMQMGTALLSAYVPNKVFMASPAPTSGYPLMEGRVTGIDTRIFICRNYACSLPMASLEEAIALVLTKR